MTDETKVTLKATILGEGTSALLFANGKLDCTRGVSMHDGWKEVAEICGFPIYIRTPARERYEDGYYSAP